MVSEGLSRKDMHQKVQQISLEKELNELLSKTNELKGSKSKQAIQTIEELKFKLKAAKRTIINLSKKFETKGDKIYCIWTGC